WSVGLSDRVATQSILPECGLCVPTSSYARKSSSPYWLASPVPVAGHPKSAPPWIIITTRCAKSSIEPLKPLAWRSPEQQTGDRVSRQHVVVRASIRGLITNGSSPSSPRHRGGRSGSRRRFTSAWPCLTSLHQLDAIFSIFGASDRDKRL